MAVIKTSKALSIWKGTAEQYAGITTKQANTLYYVEAAQGDLAGTVYLGSNRQGLTFKSVAAFPSTGAEQGVVYLGPAGESKFWNGSAWVTICYPLTQEISASSTHQQVPTALAVYSYINTFATGLGVLKPAVSTIANLKTVDDVLDKDLILVEAAGALYRFDAECTETANDDTIVASTVSGVTGRWIKMITATNMTQGNAISISNNVVSVNYDPSVFTVSESGALTMNPAYFTTFSQRLSAVEGAVEDAQDAADAAQQSADDALAAANAKIAKIAGATGGKVALTTATGEVQESTYIVGGATVSDTNTANKLATEAAVIAAVANANATVNGAKMDKISDASVAGKLLTVDATGQAVSTGVTVGTGTLAASPSTTVVATEAAVAGAVANAQIYWYEGTDTQV